MSSRRRVATSLAAALSVAIAVSACTRERRHSVMNFLFDGVPEIDASEKLDGTDPIDLPTTSRDRVAALGYQLQVTQQVIHEPVKKKQCEECHQVSTRSSRRVGSWVSGDALLLKPPTKLCFDCHPQEDAHRHGPATSGQCLLCHYPHSGPFEHLLRVETPDLLCQQCHLRDELAAAQRHAAGDLDRSCLGCHDPHGGATPALLRDAITDPIGRTGDGNR